MSRGTSRRTGKEDAVIVLGVGASGDPYSKLRNSVNGVLSNLNYVVDDAMQEIIDQVGKEGAKKLRETSPNRTGNYKKGWTYEKNAKYGRHKVSCIIRNKKNPQLTHLLEYGHPIIHKGRKVGEAKAHEHILPVKDWCEKELISRFEQKLK